MKCLYCKYVKITEHGAKGFIGTTIIACKIQNEIHGEMNKCKDFQRTYQKNRVVGRE